MATYGAANYADVESVQQPELAKIPNAVAPTPKAVEAPSYKPGMATSTGYQAAPYKVEPQGLVQNQLQSIVAKDSPLMQQAARISNQKMNDRGLVNSSMAIGAGQDAVISQAAPIAQADAAAYNTAMTNTANQENAARQFGATASNNVQLSNQAATNEALKSQQQGTIQLTNAKMTADTQVALGNLDTDTKAALTAMDDRTKSLLQSNQGASNAYVQAVTNIGQIQTNPNLGEAAKKAAIDTQINLLREQIATLSGFDAVTKNTIAYPQELTALNLGSFFQPTAGTASPAPAGVAPSTPPPAGSSGGGLVVTPPPASAPAAAPPTPYRGQPIDPKSGGFKMGGLMPGDQPRVQVPSGSPPPYPGAIKRGTTSLGGSDRMSYDVYY